MGKSRVSFVRLLFALFWRFEGRNGGIEGGAVRFKVMFARLIYTGKLFIIGYLALIYRIFSSEAIEEKTISYDTTK